MTTNWTSLISTAIRGIRPENLREKYMVDFERLLSDDTLPKWVHDAAFSLLIVAHRSSLEIEALESEDFIMKYRETIERLRQVERVNRALVRERHWLDERIADQRRELRRLNKLVEGAKE